RIVGARQPADRRARSHHRSAHEEISSVHRHRCSWYVKLPNGWAGPARLARTPRGRITQGRRDKGEGRRQRQGKAEYDSRTMLRTLRPVGLCVVVCDLCIAELLSQALTGQPPTFRADTHLVLVTVVVTDSQQNPVKDLVAGDFRVFEDGQEQPISLFSADLRPTAATAVEIQPNGVSVSNRVPTAGGVTVLLFDRLNTAWGD